jgi:hypothetical protein
LLVRSGSFHLPVLPSSHIKVLATLNRLSAAALSTAAVEYVLSGMAGDCILYTVGELNKYS